MTRTSWFFVMLAACAAQGKGLEQDAPDDGKADSFQHTTDHGAIAFASSQQATLASSAGFHSWEFSLTDTAQIHAFTQRVAHDKTLDTVLYLYKKNATTGSYGSYIARNDDATTKTELSSLTKSLGPGDYRVLVKGFDGSVKGPFGVEVDCTGAGCAPAAPAGCLFGANQDDFQNKTNPDLLINDPVRVTTPAGLVGLRQVTEARVIAAVNESGWNVTTIDDAFLHADQHEIDIVYVYDLAGARSYVAIEYGAGDNPYGAIFAETTGPEVAALHDSDIDSCTVTAQTCELHQNLGDLRSDPAWVEVSRTAVTDPSKLTAIQAQDALYAIQVTNPDVTDLATGFADIDQGELDISLMQNGALQVDLYEYGAGDNPYGALFDAGTTTLAAEIHDGDFYGCSLLK